VVWIVGSKGGLKERPTGGINGSTREGGFLRDGGGSFETGNQHSI